MQRLQATYRVLPYAGKVYKRGQFFEAAEKDAQVLIAIGRAVDATPKPATTQKAPPPRRAVPEPAPAPTPENVVADDPLAVPADRYARRDMRAED